MKNNTHNPSLHGIIINGKRGNLLSTLYTAGDDRDYPVVILLHGIPGNEQNGDLAQALRYCGFHVLMFHYSGCFGSDGDYSLAHNVDDAQTAIDFILNDEKYHFDKSRIFAVGHSLGGFACAQLAANRAEIKAAALLMPCDISGAVIKDTENSEKNAEIIDILSDSARWLRGTSATNLLTEAKENRHNFRFLSLADELSKKPLLVLEGERDTVTPPTEHCEPLVSAVTAKGGRVQALSLDTDHYASDKRRELIAEVTRFLLREAV